MNNKKVRAEKREEQARKERTAPRGGTRAGQVAHTRARRGYAGLPRGLQPATPQRAQKMKEI